MGTKTEGPPHEGGPSIAEPRSDETWLSCACLSGKHRR